MVVVRLAGYLLVLFGIVAGALLFLPAFGWALATSSSGLWFLFLACVLGGLVLVAIAAGAVPRMLLRLTGGVLVLFTLAAVAVLLLSAIGCLEPKETANLWILFVFSLPFGVVLVLIGEKLGSRRAETP
jgi:hypothetical protein